MTAPLQASHPIGLIVDDDLKRSRLTVFFRHFLVIPQAIWIVLWSIAASVALFVAWIVAIFTGRVPDGLHAFLGRYLRATAHIGAYSFLLANPWPPFLGEPGSYPVDLRIDPPAKQRRLTVFFRGLLSIPALLISYVFRLVNFVIMVLAWFYCLATGRMHEGMRNASAWMFGYELQTYGYVYLLTDRYPSFAGGPSA
jgi:Domain of unknown function (DUF4389)